MSRLPQFEFVGTVEELVTYVTSLFKDGMQLEVHCSVVLPAPGRPAWFNRLQAYGAVPAGVTASAFAPVFNAIKSGLKIEAIKQVRSVTGWGLKESKDAVEQVFEPLALARSHAEVQPGKEFSLEG